MTIKNRTDLKSYFVKNAIPTEGNFVDLIDSQLNQAQDGVFKPDGEAFSVVTAPGDQKRALRLYASYPAANPDWMICLNPAQDPTAAGTSRPGFGVTDGAGKTRLFIDAATGRIGVGTNNPQFPLDVAGGVQIQGALTVTGPIVPSVGNTENNGVQFPKDPGGGTGDRAFIRYFVESGETTKLLIGNTNEADDRISLYQMGGERLTVYNGFIGINNVTPGAALDINATSQTWNGWWEAIRFTRPEQTAITHPGGKLLFGLHADRNFYFADTAAGRYVATISTANGGSLGVGIGIEGAPERPLHVKSSFADWQARFQNDNAAGGTSNVYLAHGGGFGMQVRTDTAATNQYLLQLYNGTQGGSLFYVSTTGAVGIGAGVTPTTFKLEVRGNSVLSDAAGKYNSHFPFTDNNAYITGDNVILRAGPPSNATILTARASDRAVITTGNLAVRGMDPNQGAPRGWAGGITTFDIIVNANGFAHGSFMNGAFDLAERFAHHEDGLEPGDVLAVDPRSPERLVKSRSAQQDDLVGVVSERPGFILGVQWEDPDAGIPLALAGRVPVKVNLEGGPIRIGDYLTSSSQPGVAMRTIQSGRVIGLAMQAFDGSSGDEGKVVALVNPHWFGGR
jgi:hypothetical protein